MITYVPKLLQPNLDAIERTVIKQREAMLARNQLRNINDANPKAITAGDGQAQA